MQTIVFRIPKNLVEKGEEIYSKIKNELEKKHYGKIVVIEVNSGDYFIGERVLDAVKQAREKHPNKIFYIKRIGFKSLHTYVQY